MIAYLRGKLTYIQEESVIVEVNGVGYEVTCANPFAFQASLQKELFIFTYFHVRDDVQQLYGFKTEDEKYLFTKLLSVSGIGPKSAIGILSRAEVNQFISAVEMEDEKYLTQFPGVGKKTARQIILDLKGKLTNMVVLEEKSDTTTPEPSNNVQLLEAKEALQALGYTDREIQFVMPTLQSEGMTETNAVIRRAL